MASLTVSVVIPTYNEAARIVSVVRDARAIGNEVIVADGGSSDGTASLARDAVVVNAPRGRGAQLAAGAAAATGDVLFFLHADVECPPQAGHAIRESLCDPTVVGGNFLLRFVPETPAARLFTFANDVRRRAFSIYYGDSGIFVRRAVYERIGGFRAFPIFEDYDLVQRLEREGRTVYLREVVLRASARRFEHAPLRTLAIWTGLQVGYSVGVTPARLARFYADVR